MARTFLKTSCCNYAQACANGARHSTQKIVYVGLRMFLHKSGRILKKLLTSPTILIVYPLVLPIVKLAYIASLPAFIWSLCANARVVWTSKLVWKDVFWDPRPNNKYEFLKKIVYYVLWQSAFYKAILVLMGWRKLHKMRFNRRIWGLAAWWVWAFVTALPRHVLKSTWKTCLIIDDVLGKPWEEEELFIRLSNWLDEDCATKLIAIQPELCPLSWRQAQLEEAAQWSQSIAWLSLIEVGAREARSKGYVLWIVTPHLPHPNLAELVAFVGATDEIISWLQISTPFKTSALVLTKQSVAPHTLNKIANELNQPLKPLTQNKLKSTLEIEDFVKQPPKIVIIHNNEQVNFWEGLAEHTEYQDKW